ncbi:ubiquitin ligase (cullin) of SCF [Coemansia sp. RSA 2598]|nr:ubiquitin ligase (cullin) of SCF [Coemansia sp. RSA 2598]
MATSKAPVEDFVKEPCGYKTKSEAQYRMLLQLIKGHLAGVGASLSKLSGTELLAAYVESWENNKRAAKIIKNVFSYISRHWLAREISEGSDVLPISLVFPKLWLTEVVPKVQASLSTAVNSLLKQKREGKDVDIGLARSIAELYYFLQEQCKKIVEDGEETFKRRFLKGFVKGGADFYEAQAAPYYDDEEGFLSKFESEIWQKQEQQIAEDILIEKYVDMYKEMLIHSL